MIPPGSLTLAVAVERWGVSSSEDMTSTNPSMTISIGPRYGPATVYLTEPSTTRASARLTVSLLNSTA